MRPLAIALGLCLAPLAQPQDPPPRIGPATEKRFPPLKVPPGFKATLFACDPLIEYPSVLALGPRPGSIFLAYDYMTGLGTEIVRRDEIRCVEDTDGDGYADRSTLFAAGFNSIQGLAFHDGRVYAMHAPFLTALRDADGDGTAEERRDLLVGLGWPPEKAPDRLHCANGVAAGHDGWLYLALGDRGCDVARPEGDRLVLQGGGILRVRPDGTGLHVFSSGLRNIYDVALDEDLNVFVRDNENDGGTYMIRVCRSFFGADHGYPYLYEGRAEEALAPLADLGRGSSAGGACYLETAFPEAYRGDLFFCEWGRSVVRYRRAPAGSGFAPMKEIEFASGAPDDPYGFKPTDLIVDRDGSLLVSDWGDDQRPKRGRGRVYRIRPEGEAPKVREGLDSESAFARARAQAAGAPARLEGLGVLGRLHAVWAIARTGDAAALFRIAEIDPEPRVRVQAVRALADLHDPVLAKGRLEAAPGDPEVARRLAALGRGQDPRVLLEVTVALGRLRWAEAPAWLRENLGVPDAPLAHAAQQMLRASRNWPAVLEALDGPLRPIALRALADRAEAEVADGLIRRLGQSGIAALLARIHRKPGPWTYWGFRPGPKPANTEAWERTEAIAAALDRALADPDRDVRLAALRGMQREKVPVRPATVVARLGTERDAEGVAALLASIREAPAGEVRDALDRVVRERAHSFPNRLAALDILARGLDEGSEARLLEVAGALEDSPVLAETLRRIAGRARLDGRALFLGKLRSTDAGVRVAAIESVAERGMKEGSDALLSLLEDGEAAVRAAAAQGLGKLGVARAADRLLAAAGDPEPAVRRRSLEALARLREPRALGPALRALERDGEAALEVVAEVGGPDQAEAVAAFMMKNRSLEVLQTAARALARWRRTRELAQAQGASGLLLHWTHAGPMEAAEAARAVESTRRPAQAIPEGWKEAFAAGADSRVTLGQAPAGQAWVAAAEFSVAEPFRAQFLLSSSGALQAWVDGRPVHRRAQPGAYLPDSDRFEADLSQGDHRLVVQVSSAGPAQLQARFRRKSSVERHEKLAQLALAARGSVERGREIYLNAEKSACIKCHRLGDQGGKIGPDLTGVGRRFSRIHLVESILEPSRSVAPAFRNTAVRLKDGQVLSGVKVAETETEITLGDTQGQSHVIAKARIEEQRPLELSVMPEGLEKGLTDREFADLIAFLADQK